LRQQLSVVQQFRASIILQGSALTKIRFNGGKWVHLT